MNDQEKLKILIMRFLADDLSFEEFNREYIDTWIEGESIDELPDRDFDFFGEVHERLDFTCADPTTLERSDGWRDISEYKEWLRQEYLDRFDSAYE